MVPRKSNVAVDIRGEWLRHTVDRVQAAALTTSDIAEVASRVEPPRTKLEERLLRGLLAELAQSRSARSRIRRVMHGTRAQAPHGRGAARASAAKAVIDARFLQLNLVSQVADELHCHPVHLERVFRAAYGVSVGKYLRFARTRASLALLADRTLKIMVLPMLVGFNGRASFYRAVREFTGLTPGECRMRGVFSLPPLLPGVDGHRDALSAPRWPGR